MKFPYCLFLALALLLFSTSLQGQPAPNRAASALPRVIAVISDLHLGPGEQTIGKYYPQEDFQWGEDFITFLEALHRAGAGSVTLVIAGDMFELWESSTTDCIGDAPNFGCSEDEARARMALIAGAHRIELQALGAFASRGNNRVVIIPGNHDGALVYPSVWRIVQDASRPLRPDRFELAVDGFWISPSANVVVEHGHQFDDANKFKDWPKPVAISPSGTPRLRSPFGEALVREFFDPLEQKYPVVDNITGSAGLLYGVKREGLVGTADVFTDFIKLLSLDTSWRQFTEFLGPEAVQPPVWDLAAARGSAIEFLSNGFITEDSIAQLVQETLRPNDQELATASATTVAAMSDEEIKTICQSRYVAYLQAEKEGTLRQQKVELCPQVGGDLGYLRQKTIQRVRGSMYYVNQHLSEFVANLPQVSNNKNPVTFVYGHTHAAMRALSRPESRFTIINTGAWQRLVSAETVALIAKEKGWANSQVIDQLKLSDLPPCYSFVWIPFEMGKPADAKLRYWAYDGEIWKFTVSCAAREVLPSE